MSGEAYVSGSPLHWVFWTRRISKAGSLFFHIILLPCGSLIDCLKKVFAILLICLLLFNWYGFRFVINYLQQKADRQLESRIDVNDYDESQLIEVRVAIDMPYQVEQSSYERHYGEMVINGKIYTYVKRKVENGYLVLKCLPNTEKQNIKNAGNVLFNVNNGLDQEHNGSKNNSPLNNLAKTVFSDYDDQLQQYNLNLLQVYSRTLLDTRTLSFNSVTLPVSEQPPESL